MRPSVTVRNAVVAAAALAVAVIPGLANAATTWSVAHPPYTRSTMSPTYRSMPSRPSPRRMSGRSARIQEPANRPLERRHVVAKRATLRPVQRVRDRLRAHRHHRRLGGDVIAVGKGPSPQPPAG